MAGAWRTVILFAIPRGDFVTLVAAGAAGAKAVSGLSVNATLLVIQRNCLISRGIMFVGAFQDAIDRYYMMTANTRLLKS